VQILREICPEAERAPFGELHAEKLPDLRRLIFLGANGCGPGVAQADGVPQGMLAGTSCLKWETRSRWLNCASARRPSISTMPSTSSTPREPPASKGATLSHHNVVNNGMLIANAMRFTHRDRLCIPVPFYHCFGMVLANLACVVTGATMVIPAAYFDAEATLRAVVEERCTALHGVPPCLSRAGASRFRQLRSQHAAHRDHGRLAVPHRDHEAGGKPDALPGTDHRLRIDRGFSRNHPNHY